MIARLGLVLLAAGALGVRAAPVTPTREAEATLVLYNSNDAGSRALARYYGEKRGIPEARQIGLDCPAEEEMSRSAFLVRMLAPLRRAMARNAWWKTGLDGDANRIVLDNKIKFIAIMRGVPLKVRQEAGDAKAAVELAPELPPGSPMAILRATNSASVDSEIAALNTPSSGKSALLPNPYYRRFLSIFDMPSGAAPLLVCRIDGPSDADARRLIDNAIAAERDGLWGWAYLDARSISSPGYKAGDDWIIEAGRHMRKAGIPVIEDRAPEVLLEGFPVTDAAVYYGWYEGNVTGPFSRTAFRFLPGAIAVHIHSFSAASLRDGRSGWTAPLVALGAGATAGNVYEPYLEFTLHVDVFQDRLLSGFTLGEAAYMGTRALSWMAIVVGDPLYRPYAAWQAGASTDAAKPTPWRQYRAAVLDAGGDVLKAEPALRQLAAQTGSSMFLEALGQAQAAALDFDAALRTLREAAELETDRTVRFRLTLEQIEIFRRLNKSVEALERVHSAFDEFPESAARATLERLLLILNPPAQPQP